MNYLVIINGHFFISCLSFISPYQILVLPEQTGSEAYNKISIVWFELNSS